MELKVAKFQKVRLSDSIQRWVLGRLGGGGVLRGCASCFCWRGLSWFAGVRACVRWVRCVLRLRSALALEGLGPSCCGRRGSGGVGSPLSLAALLWLRGVCFAAGLTFASCCHFLLPSSLVVNYVQS